MNEDKNFQEHSSREEKYRSDDLQGGINVAYALLLLHAAQDAGLIKGAVEVQVDRCAALLRRGRERAIEPCPECVVRIVADALDSAGDEDRLSERFASKLFDEVPLAY